MKRKDWKTKNLKKGIFDKNIKIRVRRLREKILFLRKLFLRKNRTLIKKDLFINYVFYKNFLKLYKFKKQKYFKNIFLKIQVKKFNFFPEYSIVKNVFNKKIKFKNLIKKHKISVLFLPKYSKFNNYELYYGLNYYLLNNGNDYNNFLKELSDENNLGLIHFKIIEKNLTNLNVNYYFNYNLLNLNLIEIYKILILIYLNNIKN